VVKRADRIQMHRREVVKNLTEQVKSLSESGAEPPIDEVRMFLQQELLPLVEAAESHLMPVVERVSGEAHEVSSMALDYEVVRRYVGDIQELMYTLETGAGSTERAQLEADLRDKAIRLQAVVELLIEKESRVHLPLLEDHLLDEENERIAERLIAGHRVIKLPDSERV